jgi:hypothetical protein
VHKAKYFEEYVDPDSKEKGYRYIKDYWKDRKERNFAHFEDLF